MPETVQTHINDSFKSDLDDHEARLRLMETAVVKLSELVPTLQSNDENQNRRLGRVEKFVWAVTGGFSVLSLGIQIWSMYHH